MTIRIVTDSTADLDDATIARHQITVVPLNVHFGAESYEDGVSLGRGEFYERLKSSTVLPRTSQPSAGAFQAAYEGLSEADAIVSIHIGGKLSGTVNAARSGASLRAVATPEVTVVDSDQVTVCLGNAVVAAAEAAEAGGTAAEVAEAAAECARRGRILLLVDTLEYLQKGGRIGRARAFLGTLLRTKPVLALVDGEIAGIERPRTRQRAIKRLYELTVKTPRPTQIAILYGTTPYEAEALAVQVREALPSVAVRTVQVSPVIGVHTGPAALGAAIDVSAP
jgi:DegV family protein with EDD domain